MDRLFCLLYELFQPGEVGFSAADQFHPVSGRIADVHDLFDAAHLLKINFISNKKGSGDVNHL
jgi:hypothetical protein